MSSGPGARVVVPAIPHGIQAVSLLSSASPGPDMPQGTRPDAWLNGIGYTPESCSGGEAYAVGCKPTVGSTSEVRATGQTMPGVIYTNPFGITAYDECSTFGWEERNYQQRALDLLATQESALVEREFWTGEKLQAKALADGITTGEHDPDKLPLQWLASTHATIVGSGAYTKPLVGIAALVEAASGCSAGAPLTYHFAEGFRPILERYLTIKRNGTKMMDSQENIWVPGAGYPNTSPVDGSPAAANTYWVIATGPVRFWRTDPRLFPDNYGQALVRTGAQNDILNLLRFWADREYLVDFDRCCHFAVLIDVSTVT